MSGPAIPDDILQAARECLSAIISAGVDVHPSDQPKVIGPISHSLLIEREQFQADVIAAVADEPEACRRKVFAAIRRGFSQ